MELRGYSVKQVNSGKRKIVDLKKKHEWARSEARPTVEGKKGGALDLLPTMGFGPVGSRGGR